MSENKFYCLYSDSDQTKFLSMASTLEKLKEESEYWSEGVWFEYTHKDGSNLLENETEMAGIEFPKDPKKRSFKEIEGTPKTAFKWVS